MDTLETRAERRPARHRHHRHRDWSWIALVAGVAALVVTMALGLRFVPEGAAGAEQGVQESTDFPPATATPPSPSTTPPSTSPAPVPEAGGDLPAVQAPAGRGMLHVPPVTVDIPAIEVSSSLVDLGLNPDNSLQVPTDYAKAGWYTGGAYPGDAGGPPSLIVGHVDNKKGPAVFYALDQLEVGDEVRVGRADGSTAVFVVYDARQYPKNSLPTQEIYAERDPSELVLITCSGDFDAEAGSYLDNYVVTARLDPELSGLEA